MNEFPLVSVIMPAYNSAGFIDQAIRSIQDQTYTNWELIIVDDASRDGTISLVKEKMSLDKKIQLLQNRENQGTGVARNLGIKAAKGRYISFLDADDLWVPQKLQIQVNFMQEQDLGMSYSSYSLISEEGEPMNKTVQALSDLSYSKLLKANYIGNLTGMYDVRKTGKVYAPKLRKRQDWALWLSVLKRAGEARGIQQTLAFYRVRKAGISANKLALIVYNFKVYHQFLNFGIIKSCRYMLLFFREQFLVKSKQNQAL